MSTRRPSPEGRRDPSKPRPQTRHRIFEIELKSPGKSKWPVRRRRTNICHERNDVHTSLFVIPLCDKRTGRPALLNRKIPIPLLRRLLGCADAPQRRIVSSRRAVRSCNRGLDRSATWNRSEHVPVLRPIRVSTGKSCRRSQMPIPAQKYGSTFTSGSRMK